MTGFQLMLEHFEVCAAITTAHLIGKTKDLIHVEIKLKSETFTKCLYPLL
jgi:hypothetical protein